MWETTPPVVATLQQSKSIKSSVSDNDLDQLGVVEVGKYVGLFHEGPISASVGSERGSSRRSTPAPPTGTASMQQSTHAQSLLSPNAQPTNPFMKRPVSVSHISRRPESSTGGGGGGGTSSSFRGVASMSESSLQQAQRPQAPLAATNRAVPTTITPAHASVVVSPAKITHTRPSSMTSSVPDLRMRPPTASATPTASTLAYPANSSSASAAAAARATTVSPSATPSGAGPVVVLTPTEALVESIPCQPILAGGGGIPTGDTAADFAHPRPHSVASSMATTATDGVEWVHWHRQATESMPRGGDELVQTAPHAAAHHVLPDMMTAFPSFSPLPPPTPLPRAQSGSRTDRSAIAGGGGQGGFTTTYTTTMNTGTRTEMAGQIPPPPPTQPQPQPQLQSYAPPSTRLSQSAPLGGENGHMPCANIATAATTPPANHPALTSMNLAEEPCGFYHGMSVNNLERSFFFPAAPAPNLSTAFGADGRETGVPVTLSAAAGHGAEATGDAREPAQMLAASGTMHVSSPPSATAAAQSHSGHELMPSFNVSLTQPMLDEAMTAAANHEAALLTAMVPPPAAASSQPSMACTESSQTAWPLSSQAEAPGQAPPAPLLGVSSPTSEMSQSAPYGRQPSLPASASFKSPQLNMAGSLLAASVMSGAGSAMSTSFCSPTLAALDNAWGASAGGRVVGPSSGLVRAAGGDNPLSATTLLPPPATATATATATAAAAAAAAPPTPTFAFQSELMEPFLQRQQRYHSVKESCTDAYLTVVEQAVDSFLTIHFNPDLKSAAVAAVTGGRWGRAGQRLLQVGSSFLRRGGDTHVVKPTTGATSSPSPRPATPVRGSPSPPQATSSPSRPSAADTLRALRYTPDVIPSHYLDESPTDAALHCVALNYPSLLCTLANFFPSEARNQSGASPPAAPTPAMFYESEHAAMRDALILPTIYTVWRDYLTPLASKAKELLEIGETSVQPYLVRRLAELERAQDPPDDEASTPSEVAAEVQALQAALKTVTRSIHNTREDMVYIDCIRQMDKDFCAELEDERAPADGGGGGSTADPGKPSTRTRFQTGELSQYVPVYGLLLSRLHRLEMEHRTVLELWGPSKTSKKTHV